MNYYINRDDKEYGPYTLADLQRYVKSGEISADDLCRSEGMPGLLPVSQVVGTIPALQPVPTVYGGASIVSTGTRPILAQPPALNWVLLLLLAVVTCGVFIMVWIFVQAAFVKKLDPESKAQPWLLGYLVLGVGLPILLSLTHYSTISGFDILWRAGSAVCFIMAEFGMKSSLEDYYNSREPIGLDLNGVMVFFFNVFYFQYHFNKITERNKATQVAV